MLIHVEEDHPIIAEILSRAAAEDVLAQAMPDHRGGCVIALARPLTGPDLATAAGVISIQDVHPPFPLASLAARRRTVITVGGVAIGGESPVIMAGPCSVEGHDAIINHAIAVKAAGAQILRGGAFKPRTSPYSFQGMGEAGLKALAAAREATGLPVITEVLEPGMVDLVAEYADILQVGSRNMANFQLLKRLGRCGKPVMVKRGFVATMEEFLMSAEYILAHGNDQVILCERGIRTADPAFRFNLDLNIVPALKAVTHLPVMVDPSHGTGRRDLVAAMSLAGIAAGADGVTIEAHPDPDSAVSDGFQTITPDELALICHRVQTVHRALQCSLQDFPTVGAKGSTAQQTA